MSNEDEKRGAGRPSSATSDSNPSSPATNNTSISRTSSEVRPIDEVRFDHVGHYPDFDKKKNSLHLGVKIWVVRDRHRSNV